MKPIKSNTIIIISVLMFGGLLYKSNGQNNAKSIGKRDIKGVVMDERSHESLPYANVTIKNSSIGTSTNPNGYFVLVDVPDTTVTLEIYYIGYVTKTIMLKNDEEFSKSLTIKMKPATLQGETITVTAEKYQMWKPADEVSQVTFSPMQISKLPSLGEADIFRSLQLLPGISGVNDGSAGLYVRGGTPDQNLVILDGMTVYHVDHFFGFFSAFNSDAIKDVQVYKGGFPAKYGGRLSSVVELTGKSGDLNKTQFGFGLNLLSANAVLEVPLFEKGSFLLSARRSYTDFLQSGFYNSIYSYLSGEDETNTPKFPGPGGGGGRMGQQAEEEQPAFFFYDINSKLSYMPTNKDILALSLYTGKDYLDESQELGGLRAPQSGDDAFGTRTREEFTKWGNLGASLKWSRQWYDRFNSNILIAGSQYFSEYDNDVDFETPDAGSGINDSSNVFRGGAFATEQYNEIFDLSFRLDNEWHLSNAHCISFGTWITQLETKYEATRNDSLSLVNNDNKSLQTSFYVQDKWQLSDAWELTYGIRTTYFDKTGNIYWEPRISAQYSFWDNFKLKGAWGIYNQFIHRIVNEDILEGSRDFWLVADENFEPGNSEHYIAGINYELEDYIFEVEAYYKDMENLIEYSRRFQMKPEQQNFFFFGSGFSRGIEFLAQKKTGDLNGWISYTVGEIEHTFPSLNNGEAFPASHDRTHELKTVGTYSFGNWDFSATWVFATGMSYTSPESQYYLDMLNGETQSYIHISDKNSYRLPDYHRMDISVSYHFGRTQSKKRWEDSVWSPKNKKDDGSSTEIGLSIFNVYNNDNVWYRKYDLEVSPIVITDVKMLGFTPSAYLKVNF